MVLGFVLGFITAYISSAAIVVSWSLWATSQAEGSSPKPIEDRGASVQVYMKRRISV